MFVITVHVVILQTSSGDGLPQSAAQVVIDRLNDFYNPYGLSFISREVTIVEDDFYAVDYSDAKAYFLKSKYGKSDEITIFLLNSRANFGYAGSAHNIVSNYLSIAYGYYNRSTVEHEMGHCLGLYHTHQGTQVGSDGCPELVNGSNSVMCGDYITDTHADPCIWHPTQCLYAGSSDNVDANGEQYHPDPYNVMSYSAKQCRTVLTDGQVTRIKEMLNTEQKLIAVSSPLSISGSSMLCELETYTIEGLPKGATVEWDDGIIPGMEYLYFPVRIVEGQGTATATFRRGGRPLFQFNPETGEMEEAGMDYYVGDWTIKASVTLNGNTYVMEKTLTMPDPEDELDMRIRDVNQTGLLPLMYFGGATIELTLRTPVDEETAQNIEWECVLEPDLDSTPASLGMTMTFTGNSVEIPTPLAFTGTVRVTATNTAACNNTGTFTTEVIASVMYIDFTNPASGSVDISVKETAAGTQEGVAAMSADAEVYAEPYMGEYRLELWHEVYGMVREMDVEAGNPTVTMDLGGLTPGWYYVRLIADGEMKAVGKLMVR